jgi:hypothetical protein
MSNTDGGGSYLWDFDFNLIEECSFHQIEGPPCIKLEKKKNNDHEGTESVYAFTVRVKSSTEEEAKEITDKQAKRLVDLLAALYGKYLGYILTGHVVINPVDGSRTVRSSATIKYHPLPPVESADLSQGNFPTLIRTVRKNNKVLHLAYKLDYANKGLVAIQK